jgi:hypothetical protein
MPVNWINDVIQSFLRPLCMWMKMERVICQHVKLIEHGIKVVLVSIWFVLRVLDILHVLGNRNLP